MADALIEALRSGKMGAVRAAVKAAPAAARHPRAMVEAGRLGFLPGVELLVKNGADVNAAWKNYRALHNLIQEKPHGKAAEPAPERLACLEWLLEHGAGMELLSAWPPARALIVAAFAGQPAYVETLRRAGAGMDGFTAAALGDCKLVEKALREEADFARARDAGGLTALQCAAGSKLPGAKTVEIARLLLDAGAEVKAATKAWGHDIDAIYLAASAKNAAMFELFLEHGADATASLVPAMWNAGLDLAEAALRHGAEPDAAVADGKPLLNHLIAWGQVSQALWLLAKGASPNMADARGWTALHQAASRGNARMLRAALDAGGDVARCDREGKTPLQIAQAAGKTQLVAIMKEIRDTE